MPRKLLAFVIFTVFLGTASAQDLSNIQIHGFATQALLYSGSNNYLGVNTSQGSTGWTEGAINIVDQPSDKLRIGIQLHYTRLGIFGGDQPSIDWAMGDYRFNNYIGLRASKVKIRWGLYNDSQDADPGYLWSLLPESIYSIDDRSTTLSQLGAELYGNIPLSKRWGAELYGNIPLSKRWGTVLYSLYFGDYFYASDDAFQQGFRESGLAFSNTPSGKTPGVDLRWKTPLKGLIVGASTQRVDAKGVLTNGIFRIPPYYSTTGYAQFDAHKLFLAYQYARTVNKTDVTFTGQPTIRSLADTHSWFVMAGYHFTEKFQAGTYYSSELDTAAHDNSNPANFGHDWTISTRYDFNSYLYGKLEGHFINGNVAGFYDFDNPNGLRPRTRLVVAKVGFAF